MRSRIIFIVMTAAIALSACALSPQTVTLKPTLEIPRDTIGNAGTVKVLVTDMRNSSLVGTRGGIYEKTSEIRSDNDVADAIRQQVQAGLLAQGFKDGGNEAETTLRIRLMELQYAVPPGAVTTSASIVVAIEITAERGGGRHTATYRSEVSHRFPVTPTATQNEIWINDVLSETLQRFFNDAQMRTFITKKAK